MKKYLKINDVLLAQELDEATLEQLNGLDEERRPKWLDESDPDVIAYEANLADLEINNAITAVKFALQNAVDTKAAALGFSSGNALMLYAGFTNPFKTMALKFAQWEASVWTEAEAYKAQVIAGTAPMLTPDQAVAMMPAYPV